MATDHFMHGGNVLVQVQMTDCSTASTHYVYCPCAGKVVLVGHVAQSAITAADAALTYEIDGTAITGAATTVELTAAAAGDSATATPTALFTVAKGNILSMVSDGGSTTATLIAGFFVIEVDGG